jgi:dipeptidyl aminopeptidase/acylaminoacyl peptidase
MRPRHADYSALPLPEAENEDASLQYAISCWPVIDPLARYERARDKGNQELVERHDRFFLTIDAQIDANPVRILEREEDVTLPPVLLCHGTEDDSVPYEWVTRFAQLYRLAGGDASVETFEGAPHGFGRQPEYKDRLLSVTKAFIERRLKSGVAV